MAPSTPPPPPDTSTSSAATATTAPLFQNPPRPPNRHNFHYSPPPPRLPSNPNPNYPQLAPRPPHSLPHPQDPSQLLYPVASSGRGFLTRPVALPATRSTHRPPFMFPYPDQGQGQGNPVFVRSNHLPHLLAGSAPSNSAATGAMPGVVNGIPVPSSHQTKVGSPSASLSDNNGHKDSRDRTKDDAFVILRDRKVRIHEDAALYSLCRSWLRNSFPEETQQPQYLDTVKSLPRPLPIPAQDANSPDKTAKDKEEEDEDKDSCENLSEKELLQRHIKRAKRVRSRLREERLQRITRYKTRLALLLPPMVEQHFKNDSGPAN
ncbi:pollen-specific leucine-rich repeat extensin-like protein 2 isoform X1 [Salvia splendens]|uniref:pollen-specific leucine-rich repeat extensin-like protein 2 isoform X1 n=1 Tax=Salvia splendens TaxID=180675 RepID=UPI001C273CE5|nr:pollen-specific leucine-rich repeat extensin-like protein 2 isoform X1 [Salvia splendens]